MGIIGFISVIMESDIRLALWQRNNKNRFAGSAQNPLGGAAQKSVGQKALAVGAHDDRIAIQFIGLLKDFIRGESLRNYN